MYVQPAYVYCKDPMDALFFASLKEADSYAKSMVLERYNIESFAGKNLRRYGR
jgi:hypothetical protein